MALKLSCGQEGLQKSKQLCCPLLHAASAVWLKACLLPEALKPAGDERFSPYSRQTAHMAQEGLPITFSSQAGSCGHGSKASRNRRHAGPVAAAGWTTPVKVNLLPHTWKSGSTAGSRGRDMGQMFRATIQTKKCLQLGSEEAGQQPLPPTASSQTKYQHLSPASSTLPTSHQMHSELQAVSVATVKFSEFPVVSQMEPDTNTECQNDSSLVNPLSCWQSGEYSEGMFGQIIC